MVKEILMIALVLTGVIESIPFKRGFRLHNGQKILSWLENPFKFLVSLRGTGFCTGNIYNANTVITAGHCFLDPRGKPAYVDVAFISNQVNSGVNININNVAIPEHYEKNYKNDQISGEDIAVVKLTTALDVNGSKLTSFNGSSVVLSPGTVVIIAGFGLDTTTEIYERQLKRGNLVVANCRISHGDNRICAKPEERFSNQLYGIGDSGGPIMTEDNGKYTVSGFLSGGEVYVDDLKLEVFASYLKNEEFIKKSAQL